MGNATNNHNRFGSRPLGREVEVAGSAYVALRVTTVTASGTPNYQVGVTWEE